MDDVGVYYFDFAVLYLSIIQHYVNCLQFLLPSRLRGKSIIPVKHYTVSQKNRTLLIFSNISDKSLPILIIFGTENRQ